MMARAPTAPAAARGASRRVHQKVRAEAPAPVGVVHRELSEKDDRDRVGHVPADSGRHPAPFHGTGGEAVETGDAVAVAGDIGARAAPGLVQPCLAPEPGVEGGNARGELRDVVAGGERLRRS